MFGLFNGVVRPYASLPVFWKYWMYYVNPSTYWIGGMLAATLDGAQVQCSPDETAVFDAPPGQTCLQYAGDFARQAGGYLLNEDATSACQYCPMTTGNQFLTSLNIEASDKWRSKWTPTNIESSQCQYMMLTMQTDFGIFLAFCVSARQG